MRGFAAIALTATMLSGTMPLSANAQAWRTKADQVKATDAESDQWVEVVFNTGRVVYGKLVEESDDVIAIMVHIEGLPPTRAQYNKYELIEIRRGLASPKDKTLGNEDTAEQDRESTTPSDFPETTATGGEINNDTTKFYFAPISGNLGSSITRSLLERYFKDIDETFDDLVDAPNPNGSGTIKVVDPAKRDKNIVVFRLNIGTQELYSFGQVEDTTRRVGELMEEQIDIKGRRVIYLVDETTNGACFFMFTCPEVYFTTGAEMVGYGVADLIGQGADEVVREKWIGITISAMTSIAHANGYGLVGEHVVKALARRKYWFAYQMNGAKPITTLDEPDNWNSWIILSDDGEGNREDNDELDPNKTPDENDIADSSVNPAYDHLEIGADDARRLGLSKGTVNSVEDLAFELGVERNYVEYASERAQEIQDRYFDEVQKVWFRIEYPNGDLWEEFRDLETDIQNAESESETIRHLNSQIRIIRRVMSSIERYDDITFPQLPAQQMEVMIEQRVQQIRRIRAN